MKKIISTLAITLAMTSAAHADSRRVDCIWWKSMDELALQAPASSGIMTGKQAEAMLKKRKPEVIAKLRKVTLELVSAAEKHQKDNGLTDEQISTMLLLTGSKAASPEQRDLMWRVMECW